MAKDHNSALPTPVLKRLLMPLAISIILLEILSGLVWYALPSEFAPKKSVQHLINASWEEPSHRPSTFWHHSLNPRHKDYAGILNSFGMKGEEFSFAKPANEYRIVCLGDSTTESIGVNPSESYPIELEKALSNVHLSNDRFVRVINAGIGSHNSAFNLAYLAYFLIHLKPDMVVVKSSYNDYLPFIVPGMVTDYTHAFPEPYSLDAARQLHWLVARFSFTLRLIAVVAMAIIDKPAFSNFSGEATHQQLQAMDITGNEQKFYVYGEHIRSMIALCQIRGIECVVVDLPTSGDPNHYGSNAVFGERYRELIARLEQELKSVCAEEGVPFVRTTPLLDADFWDHCHNTPSGNRKIAARIAKQIAPIILGSQPTPHNAH